MVDRWVIWRYRIPRKYMAYSTNPMVLPKEVAVLSEDNTYYDIKFFTTETEESYWVSNLKLARIYDSYAGAVRELVSIRLIESLVDCECGVDLHPEDRYEVS